MSTTSTANSLQLVTLPHPADRSVRVKMFATAKAACMHLCDHLLTAPECNAWVLVSPQYRNILDPADADARWRYAQQAHATNGASAQELYDLYAEATAADARDAQTLGWFGQDDYKFVTVAIGTSGILLTIEGDILKTAFLPGQGQAETTREVRQSGDCRTSLPRERGMRSGRNPTARAEFRARERAAQERREAAWNDEERLYYKVFRPAVQLIKRCHHLCCDMFGQLKKTDYALLKGRLPARNQLKYPKWLHLRHQCRGGSTP
ncbi:MAG: hypothetical protein NZ700_00975 [Gemmataceae bacterium]|nr:hypothetical protein [Gemmataceae bacterium]MDW8265789.1 hypothetical protein [Gemmataceae bacterium]